MNATKLMLCAVGATILTSTTAFGAMASPVDGRTGQSLSPMLTSVHPQFITTEAVAGKGSADLGAAAQIALNPQPLPPGIVDEDHFAW